MDTSFNIVDLIQKNTRLQLSPSSNNSFIRKVTDTFTETQQQLFVSSFYCYLNYHQTNDFIIDLDNIWEWLGFSQKAIAKRSLEKFFTTPKDYKVLSCRSVEQKQETRGGHNKEKVLLNIRTFKLFCIKAGTQKANEVHEYFIKLEDVINEIIKEECTELKKQLEDQQLTNKLEKELLREKTVIEQFPENKQCVYYGIIDDTNDKNELLIKYGNSNNLQQRVDQHKNTYTNFRLVNAFKVENKQQIENAVKKCKQIMPFKRSITIKDVKHTEILAINNLSFDKLDTIFKNIVATIEYSPENYINLLSKYTDLKTENDKLKVEIKKIKQQNTIEDPSKRNRKRMFQKHKDNCYYVNSIKYLKLFGTRQEVWDSVAYKTSGQLIKEDLTINPSGKVVSKTKSQQCLNDLRPMCKKRLDVFF
jgi:phage anti-repressor protein